MTRQGKQRKSAAICSVLCSGLLLAPPVAGRSEPRVCGTERGGAALAVGLHRSAARSLERRRWTLAAAAAPGRSVGDVGEIAVVDTSDGVLMPRNSFDLQGQSLNWRAVGEVGSRYRFEVGALAWDSEAELQGTRLNSIQDDDFREFAIPFGFPFFSGVRETVYVHSDGNLSFAYPEASSNERSLGRLTSGPPRVAPLFEDLDPSQGGASILVYPAADRMVITYSNVPEYASSGVGVRQSFQVLLYPNGDISFQYKTVTPLEAVVGISPGSLAPGTELVNYSSEGQQEYSSSVVEKFGEASGLDLVRAAQRFYETHADDYDYLVFFNTLGIAAGSGALAVETTVRSYVDGIGDTAIDMGASYGSARQLKAIMNMGPLTQYPSDPYWHVGTRGLITGDTTMSLLGHEAGHLWLALASVRDPGSPSARPMLGAQLAHWSFNFNSEASLLEGNRIQDLGASTLNRFLTVGTVEGYSPLDQYLMGFRPPEEVPPTFLVRGGPIANNAFPQKGIAFRGSRQDVTIQDVISAEGPRIPDATATQRRFRFAFILVTPEGAFDNQQDTSKLEVYRKEFESYFASATGGRAQAECTLRPQLRTNLRPSAGVVQGESLNVTIQLQEAAPEDLPLRIETSGSIQAQPDILFAKGTNQTSFQVSGSAPGAGFVRVSETSGRYAMGEGRVIVQPGRASLRLEKYFRDNPLLVLKITDGNRVPYPGVCVTDGASRTCSDDDGLIWIQWDGSTDFKYWIEQEERVVLNLPADAGR